MTLQLSDSENKWPALMNIIATKLGGCTASSLGHVLELTTPVVSAWIKGHDSKGLPSAPSPAYAVILTRMAQMDSVRLKEIFRSALDYPSLAELKTRQVGKASNRQVDLKTLLKERTALDVLVTDLFSVQVEATREDLQAQL